jgi:hypothetical protein
MKCPDEKLSGNELSGKEFSALLENFFWVKKRSGEESSGEKLSGEEWFRRRIVRRRIFCFV